MFNVNSKPVFVTTLTFEQEDIEAPKQSFRAWYRALSDEEIEKYPRVTRDEVVEFLRAVIVKLDDIVEEGEKPVPYGEALRERMLGQQYARSLLYGGYFKAVTEARLGN